MLNIQNYTKRFGDKIAVDDLSLHIAAGEICAFIGHNGAGKTTTLKACCGLLKPDGGTITVNGIDIQKDPIACKKIMAYIPDNPDLYEFLTGYEYLNFVADMYGVSEADRKARMEALAERLDIKNALPNLISECSHGMKQKIAVIGALIHEPKLILMDEPFVGLDPIAAHELKEIRRSIAETAALSSFPHTFWKWRRSCATMWPLSKTASSLHTAPWTACAATVLWSRSS